MDGWLPLLITKEINKVSTVPFFQFNKQKYLSHLQNKNIKTKSPILATMTLFSLFASATILLNSPIFCISRNVIVP